MKKTLALIMVCICALSGIFANGSTEKAVQQDKYALQAEHPTLKILMSPSSYDYNERPEAKDIERMTDYHIVYDKLPSENTEQTLALMMASGSDYDAVQTTSASSFSSLMSNGALLRLNDYIDNIAPEFWDAVPSEYWQAVSDENGNVYALPYNHPRNTNIVSNFVVRMDLVRAAGITELPTTLSGFTAMLEQLKAFYGDQYIILTGPFCRRAQGNELPIDMCLASAFGIYNEWMVDENGKVIYITEHKNFPALVEYYNRLYNEGILDKDFAANTYKDTNERLSSGRAIIAFNSTNSGVNTVYPALLKLGLTDDDIAFIGPLEGDDGVCTYQKTTQVERFFFIPVNNTKNTPDLFNWLKLKFQNQTEITLGKKDVHYYIADDGYPSPIQPIFNDERNQGYVYLTLVDYNRYAEDWLCRVRKTDCYWRLYNEVTIGANKERPWIFVPAYFTLCNKTSYMENKGTIESNLCDYFVQLVTGSKTLDSSYKAFMNDFRNEEGETVRKDLQDWYDRNWKNK